MTFATFVQVAFGGMVMAGALPALRNPRWRIVVRSLRWRDAATAAGILLLVLPMAAGLVFYVPGMDIGWMKLLTGHQGNALVPSAAVAGGDDAGIGVLFLVAMVLTALLASLPLLVLREERSFRRASEGEGKRKAIIRQMGFGLIHMLVGIPLGAALAIGMGGWCFRSAYLRGYSTKRSRQDAVIASTRIHLAYNTILLAPLTAVLWIIVVVEVLGATLG